MATKKFPPSKKPQDPIIKIAPKRDWSEYQKAIFKDIARGQGHTIIEAFAGSAKTSTSIESFKYVPRGKSILALAFNKKNQEDLRSRSPSYVECFTFHSLGLRAIKQKFGNVEIDDYKVSNIITSLVGKDADFDLVKSFCDVVAYCKYSLSDTPRQINDLIDNPNLSIDLCEYKREDFITVIIKALAIDKADTVKIDFNDMCYFPYVYNLPMGSFDYVYVDEFQDTNRSQIFMTRKACKPITGRIVALGDSFQDLYEWRLSDLNCLKEILKEPNAKTLTLPISYRCPKKVIDLAKHWVPDITCPDSAIDGEIIDIHLNKLVETAKPGSFVISRVNAPLIKLCMAFIRAGKKANIRGRDIGQNLIHLVKKSKKKQIPAFLNWLAEWKDEQCLALKEKNINIENTLDRYECLVSLCEDSSSLEEVTKKINDLFDDSTKDNSITLTSVHRSKGDESENVFLLKYTFRIWLDERMAQLEKPNNEANIAYVAATRSKKNLYIVNK